MSYSLEQKLSNKEIQMTLSVREKSTSKMYSCVLSEQNLSRELSNKFKTIEELFQLFETENNF